MSGRIHCSFIGRFGNTLFSYLFCRAYALRHGLQLTTDHWDGEKIFDLPDTHAEDNLSRRDENNLIDGEYDFTFRSYAQNQKCLIYTRTQVKQWLRFKPHIADALGILKPDVLLAHQRLTDYRGYGYPLVSRQSYFKACDEFGLDKSQLRFVSDEHPTVIPGPWPDYLPDFWRLVHAKVLLRGNSSFSFWAAVLSDGDVYAPVIEGQPGGEERDYPFIHSNHPRFNTQGFLTDLYLEP